jgi:hypothetical protein
VPGRSKETNAGNGVRRNFAVEKHLEREQNSDFAIIIIFIEVEKLYRFKINDFLNFRN